MNTLKAKNKNDERENKNKIIANTSLSAIYSHRRRLHGAQGARAPPIFWPRGSSSQRAPPQ